MSHSRSRSRQRKRKKRIFVGLSAWLLYLTISIFIFGKPVGLASTKRAKQMDLTLVLNLDSPTTIFSGDPIEFTILLKNRSKLKTHRIIHPDDRVGYPSVSFRVEYQREGGTWVEVPPLQQIDFVGTRHGVLPWRHLDLDPSACVEIPFAWFPYLVQSSFERPGIYKFQVQYRYDDVWTKSQQGAARPKQIKKIPAFTLISNPVEIKIHSPLDPKFDWFEEKIGLGGKK